MKNYATRNFSYRTEDGIDHSVTKGADVTKLKPAVEGDRLDDFRHCGLVGDKPADEPKAAAAA